MPEVEIDIDDLLEVNSDDERASKLQVYAVGCIYKSIAERGGLRRHQNIFSCG